MPIPLKCSTCSAPLDVADTKGSMIRCPYCGSTMILPASRGGASESETVNGSLGSLIDQSLKLAEVARLAQSGNKIAAIKLYRETFGVGLKEAKDAVERIEAGQPVTYTATAVQSEDVARDAEQYNNWSQSRAAARKKSKARASLATIIILLIILIGAIIARKQFGPFNKANTTASAVTPGPAPSGSVPGLANAELEFGSEGIGAGQFKDARSIAIDGQGRIYVGEYTGGRVQVFDQQGKFITQWMVDSRRALLNLAVDRNGVVYAVHPSQIIRYDGPTGNPINQVGTRNSAGINEFYSDAVITLDGSLYAIGGNSNILRIVRPNDQIKTIVNVRKALDDNTDLNKIAVDGTGNIYALGRFDNYVFKFSADGKFVNKFCGRGREPGQLTSPNNIAVDGQGRVYVSDSGRAIQVFDGDGRYTGSFGGTDVVFGLAVNDRNECFALHRNKFKVVKYTLGKK